MQRSKKSLRRQSLNLYDRSLTSSVAPTGRPPKARTRIRKAGSTHLSAGNAQATANCQQNNSKRNKKNKKEDLEDTKKSQEPPASNEGPSTRSGGVLWFHLIMCRGGAAQPSVASLKGLFSPPVVCGKGYSGMTNK